MCKVRRLYKSGGRCRDEEPGLSDGDALRFLRRAFEGESEKILNLSWKKCKKEISEEFINKDIAIVIGGEDFINKINNAMENGIKVIYCIGESLSDKENGNTYMTLEKQISEVLNNVELKGIMIAYEPVWAIGSGIIPTTKEIKENIGFIKDIIEEKYDIKLKVLYGGSVNSDNISELNTIKNVDGFLVGGASTNIDSLESILIELEK